MKVNVRGAKAAVVSGVMLAFALLIGAPAHAGDCPPEAAFCHQMDSDYINFSSTTEDRKEVMQVTCDRFAFCRVDFFPKPSKRDSRSRSDRNHLKLRQVLCPECWK
jgi:hypothetical protein